MLDFKREIEEEIAKLRLLLTIPEGV